MLVRIVKNIRQLNELFSQELTVNQRFHLKQVDKYHKNFDEIKVQIQILIYKNPLILIVQQTFAMVSTFYACRNRWYIPEQVVSIKEKLLEQKPRQSSGLHLLPVQILAHYIPCYKEQYVWAVDDEEQEEQPRIKVINDNYEEYKEQIESDESGWKENQQDEFSYQNQKYWKQYKAPPYLKKKRKYEDKEEQSIIDNEILEGKPENSLSKGKTSYQYALLKQANQLIQEVMERLTNTPEKSPKKEGLSEHEDEQEQQDQSEVTPIKTGLPRDETARKD